MLSLEEIRQEVVSVFQQVHEANYPDTLVNYPDYSVVDLEHQTEPFVSLGLDMGDIERTALGEKEILVKPTLMAIFYYREGNGSTGKYSYTDMLNEFIGMEQVGALSFRPVKVYNVQTFPGWKGLMNEIQFDIVPTLDC